jgi:hypothetical protein
MGGIVVRNPFEEVPSGNPLSQLEPRRRAVYVLLEAGEDPTVVGVKLTKGPRAEAHLRAFKVVDQARLQLGVTPRARARMGRLRVILPDELVRWTFLLRACGAFEDMTELAVVLGCHRASCYRHLETARALILAHVEKESPWEPIASTVDRRRSSPNRAGSAASSAGGSTPRTR